MPKNAAKITRAGQLNADKRETLGTYYHLNFEDSRGNRVVYKSGQFAPYNTLCQSPKMSIFQLRKQNQGMCRFFWFRGDW